MMDSTTEIMPAVLEGEILPPRGDGQSAQAVAIRATRTVAEFKKEILDALRPGSVPYFVFEKKVAGHCVRVTPKGDRCFYYRRRQDGRLFRKRLKPYVNDRSLKASRALAEKLNGARHDGDLHEKYPSRRAAAGAHTLADLLRLFLEDKAEEGARPNYLSALNRRIRRRCKSLLLRSAGAIELEELEVLWEGITDKPAEKRILAVQLRALFRWSLKKRRITNNPMAGAFLPKAPDPSDQHLNGDQMRRVFAAAGRLKGPRAAYVQLLMMLLVRRTELAKLRRSDISKDLTEILIPAERMKGGKHSHFVPVPPAAQAILRSIPRHAGSDLVFSFDGVHASVDSHTMDRLKDELAHESLPPFSLHDFRRSGATWLAREGIDDVTIEMLLAHKARGKVAGTYNLHAREAERRVALEVLSSFLAGAEGQVVSLSAPRQPPKLTQTPALVDDGVTRESLESLLRSSEIAEKRTYLVAKILADSKVRGSTLELGRRKQPIPKYAHRSVEEVSITIAWLLADAMLQGTNDFRRRHIEGMCAAWTTRRDYDRAFVERCRVEVKQARDHGKTDHALSVEDELRRVEAEVRVLDLLIKGARQHLNNPSAAAKLDDETQPHPADRATALQDFLLAETDHLFTEPAPHFIALYVEAGTGKAATPFRGRHRRAAELKTRKQDDARCGEHEENYNRAFKPYDRKAPPPSQRDFPWDYRRRLFAIGQAMLPSDHDLAKLDAQAIDGKAIVSLEKRLFEALSGEAKSRISGPRRKAG
jgi:integrase